MSQATCESDNAGTLGRLTDLELTEPFFPLVSFFLAECEVDEFLITVLRFGKWDHMLRHVAEVVSSIGVFACSKTLS